MFVYDIKIISMKKRGVIARVKIKLAASFLMVDMGPISFYQGFKVEKDQEKNNEILSTDLH